MGVALERVTAALTDWGSTQRDHMWNCPTAAHTKGDEHRSLSVTSNDKGVGFYCHLGCAAEEIAKTIGLNMADLFDEELVSQEVAQYNYVNGDGEILFAKIRYEPKGFSVRHPNGTGWEKGLGNARPVLYHLPEVKAAIARGETVYIVEGEKDADRLAREGLTATTNFDGAGKKWRSEYSEMLAGSKSIIVIADRDEAGYSHAQSIKESLTGRVDRIKVLQSAVTEYKADVSDHLNAGYGIKDLVPLNGSGFKIFNLANLVSKGVPQPTFLAGFLYAGGLHCIAGAPDCGKTTIALHWALQILQQQQYVAFLDEEGGPEIVAEKLIALGATSDDLDYLTYIPFPGKTWTDEDIGDLLTLMKETGPAFILWDSSAAFLARAGLDENSASAVTNWWARVLSPTARELGAAVLVIDHDVKSSEQSRYARGSGAKLAGLDVQFKVEIVKPFTREQTGTLKFHVSKDRRGWLHREWQVDVNPDMGLTIQFAHAEDTEEEVIQIDGPPARQKIYNALSDVPRGYRQIVDAVHEKHNHYLSRQTVSTELNELLRRGLVDSMPNSGYETLWIRKPPDTCQDTSRQVDDTPVSEMSPLVSPGIGDDGFEDYLRSSDESPW